MTEILNKYVIYNSVNNIAINPVT